MASSNSNRIVLAAALASVLAPAALAQAPDGCTYDRCALRFEEPFVVRGLGAERLVRLSWWSSPRLTPIMQRSDSALYHARLAEASQRRGVVAGGVSLVTAVAAAVWAANTESGFGIPDPEPFALLLGAEVIAIYGQFQLRDARRSLGRAIWWYNRHLPR
ncbi:MAG: hypothetical protein ABR499_20325 [Gemmatimonadaceae bacterium]